MKKLSGKALRWTVMLLILGIVVGTAAVPNVYAGSARLADRRMPR